MTHRDGYVADLDPSAVLIQKLKSDAPLLVYGAHPRGAGCGEFEFQMAAAATGGIGGIRALKDHALGLLLIEPLQAHFLLFPSSPGGYSRDVFQLMPRWISGSRYFQQ